MPDTNLFHDEGLTRVNAAALGVMAGNLKVKLIKAPFSQGKGLSYADLASSWADFSGYTDWVVTFGAPALFGDIAIAESGSNEFSHDGGPTANTVHGGALVEEIPLGAATLLSTIKLATPVGMAAGGDRIDAEAMLRMLTA